MKTDIDIKIGDICRSEHGDVGIILEKRAEVGFWKYIGASFDGKRWSSVMPIYLSSSINEYLVMEQMQK